MDAASIIETLKTAVAGASYEEGKSVDFATVYVPAAALVETCRALRDTPALRFNVLVEVTAADYLPREPRFEIVYAGHGDLRRLLLPEDWDGHPARKDYPVQIRKAAQTYEPLEVTEDEFR